MGQLFQRKKNVIINNRRYVYPDFEINFTGDFDDDPEPDIYTVEILNLSLETISSIKKGDKISLSAGYDTDVGTIFSGEIKNVETYKSRTEVVTKIDAQNVNNDFLKNIVSFTLNGPVTNRRVIEEIAARAGIEVAIADINDVTYNNGKTIHGPINQELKKVVVTDSGSSLLIRDNKITITNATQGFQTGFLLSADTGLIGMPRKIDAEDSKGDYLVKCLVNPNIRLRSLIEIDSRVVKGQFTVVEGKYNKDFTMDLKVIAFRR